MSGTAAPAPVPLTAPLGRMLTEHARAQLLTFARDVALSVATIVLPSMLYAFIAMSDPNRLQAPGVTFGAYYLASMGAYAVSAVMIFNFGVTVAVDRGQRVDLLIRAGPVPPLLYLAARVITAFVFALAALVVLFSFAYLVVGLRLALETWLALGGALLVGAAPFVALGFAIAYLAGPSAAVAIANISYLALTFASGIFIPLDSLPEFVRGIAPYLPTYHFGQMAWTAVGVVDQPIAASLAWLAGYGLLFIAIAAWAYRREEGRMFG